jgi:hypothetical protein
VSTSWCLMTSTRIAVSLPAPLRSFSFGAKLSDYAP